MPLVVLPYPNRPPAQYLGGQCTGGETEYPGGIPPISVGHIFLYYAVFDFAFAYLQFTR